MLGPYKEEVNIIHTPPQGGIFTAGTAEEALSENTE